MYEIAMGRASDRIIVGEQPEDPFLLPAFHLIDPKSYHRKIDGKTSLPFLTSRGCPFSCAFCGLSKMHEHGVKMASPEKIAEQLKILKLEFGITSINFQDDIFTMNPTRLYKLLDLIEPLGITFRCMGKAGYDNEETYRRLAKAGCIEIAWGIESGSQYMLDRMKKQVTVEDNYNVIQWAKKYGITSRAFFIIGFPGETKDTLEETKEFIIRADPDQYFVSSFVPYPGTDVAINPAKYGITSITEDKNQFYQVSKDGTGGLTIDTEWLSREEFRGLELSFRNWLKYHRKRRYCYSNYDTKAGVCLCRLYCQIY
jgi:anaerobic magnesium-protoporphyrin IX monomethyl ester cyclase